MMGSSPLFPVLFLVLVTGSLGYGALSLIPVLAGGDVPPPAIRFLPGEIPVLMNASVSAADLAFDEIAALPDSERMGEETLYRFEEIMTRFDDQTLLLAFVRDEYPDPTIAEEAGNATFIREIFLNKVYLRSDIANALSIPDPSDEDSNLLKTRLLDDFHLAFQSPEVKDEITRLGMNLSEFEGEYQSNQWSGTASLNLFLMNRITDVRQQIVSLLGIPSFAVYQVARSGIRTNLTGLTRYLANYSEPFSRASHEEAGSLLVIKQKREPEATRVFDYEIASLRMNSSSFILSAGTAAEPHLIPADKVIQRSHSVISQIFGIAITPEPDNQSGIPGLNLYRITDPETGATRAWFWLLLKPSEDVTSASGKTYYLRSGRGEGESRIPAVSAIVLTIPSRDQTSPLLLSPDSLDTLFHEYGHMLRHSLSLGRYGTLSSGARELTGYNEVYSQLLERFSRTPEVLDQIYGTNEEGVGPFPGENISSFPFKENRGLIDPVLYDLLLADLDLSLHSGNATYDFLNLYNNRYTNLTGFQGTTGGGDLLINPAFFISGNAGVYWHYLVDDLYAEELFSRFRSYGVLNRSSGLLFRKEILEHAGSGDPEVLMEKFLGHPTAIFHGNISG